FIHIAYFFFFQAEDGIRDFHVTGVQTCALPILSPGDSPATAETPCAVRSSAGPPVAEKSAHGHARVRFGVQGRIVPYAGAGSEEWIRWLSPQLGIADLPVSRQAALQHGLQRLVVRQIVITKTPVGQPPRMGDDLDKRTGAQDMKQVAWGAVMPDARRTMPRLVGIHQSIVDAFKWPYVASQVARQPHRNSVLSGKDSHQAADRQAVVHMLVGVDVAA